MALIRYQKPEAWGLAPFRKMSNLRDEIDQVFDRMFRSPWDLGQDTQFMAGWSPAIDLFEDKDNLVVKAELPGLKKEDIDISLHEGLLTVSGERKEEKKEESTETYRSERYVGRFQRTFSLPFAVDENKITATYKDGVLTVTLPKTEEAKPKQIVVNVR
jgi:HSP20 family protein